MKRSLVGSSLCLLLLTGYAAPNAGVAFAAAPAFPAVPVTPVSSTPNSTIQAPASEPVILAGLTPTQFVPYAAARIRAAKTDEELQQFERYFLNYHSRLSEFLANSNPSTAVERDRYWTATQIMALMRELASACKFQRESKGLATQGYNFQNAQAIANDIESSVLKNPPVRQKSF